MTVCEPFQDLSSVRLEKYIRLRKRIDENEEEKKEVEGTNRRKEKKKRIRKKKRESVGVWVCVRGREI
jgi:hypothetical protein